MLGAVGATRSYTGGATRTGECAGHRAVAKFRQLLFHPTRPLFIRHNNGRQSAPVNIFSRLNNGAAQRREVLFVCNARLDNGLVARTLHRGNIHTGIAVHQRLEQRRDFR